MSIKVPPRTSPASVEVREERRKPRFELTANVPARMSGVTVRLVDVSAGGVQIEHRNGLRIGTVMPLVIDASEPIELLVRVVWCRFMGSAGGARNDYRCGAVFEGSIEPVAGRLGRFLRAYGRLDQTSMQRKREQQLARAQVHSPIIRFLGKDEIQYEDHDLMIRQARERLAADPAEALKWYNRAKFALAERFDISAELAFAPHKQDVLAIWEYLGRRIEVKNIVRAFEKRR